MPDADRLQPIPAHPLRISGTDGENGIRRTVDRRKLLSLGAAASTAAVAAAVFHRGRPVEAASGDWATLATQSPYPTVNPGERVHISMTPRNSGTTTWSPRTGYGYIAKDNWSYWGQRPLWRDVRPDETITFEDTVTAPQTPGAYNCGFILTHNGIGFGPYFFIQVTVRQAALSDAQLIQNAQQAARGKPQPERYGSCLVYAQARGGVPIAGGNYGAFNLLFVGNNARLNSRNQPTVARKPLRSLAGISDLTQALHPGDFIVWDRGVAGADGTYGHIAVVEIVLNDRLVISQAGWPPTWKVLHVSYFAQGGMYAYPKGTP